MDPRRDAAWRAYGHLTVYDRRYPASVFSDSGSKM
jgi:hypothetical protein